MWVDFNDYCLVYFLTYNYTNPSFFEFLERDYAVPI